MPPEPPGVSSSVATIPTDTIGVPVQLGPWRLLSRDWVLAPDADQGVATVAGPGGATRIVYAGDLSLTAGLADQGWVHVGDPDGWQGWLVTPFQGPAGAGSKMFRVTEPDGTTVEAVHPLIAGEAYNNSFAAVTPDGRWTVAGEWGSEHRLLIFPTPLVNPSWRPGQALPLAGVIELDRPVDDLQGCAFASATVLYCSGPADLARITLDHPITGGSVGASTGEVGPIPQLGGCQGTYEPEGVDIDRQLGQLRLEVNQPGSCDIFTQVYAYRWAPAGP